MAGASAPAPRVEARGPAPQWHDLHFRIRKLFFTVDAALDWRRVPAASAARELLPVAEGRPRAPAGHSVVRLRLRIRHFLGRLDRTVWFDPDSGMPLQVREQSDGDTVRIWRYLEDGVLHVRERRSGPDGATDVLRRRTAWTVPQAAAMIEADTLLYLLPASDLLEPGQRRRFILRVKGRPVAVEARVETAAPADGARREGGAAGPSGQELVRIVLDAVDERETLRAIGLRGPLEVYLDPRSRAPVRVQGRLKWIGRVKARLVRPPG